ncbi:DUF1684 domain-containing protein [Curtobacterium sp. MCSS17_015]|uniref:DUF1684 domain-containing protein n=1 Tax=Curtobacterium sp. MCSS17_015 TaxID=2175666 RepID=UPI000DAAC770|nr:DUF1684 domain-containing protein [Curtobacterium sp. MCSS17_015]WIB27137.1 DUF1684 domain-containing protein [Curtobacterium sp. MCSS17_015]
MSITDPDTTHDAPASWDAWRAARRERVTGAQGDLALIRTEWLPIGQEPDLDAALADQPETVTATRVRRIDLDTGAPQHGHRLWDADSPAIRSYVDTPVFPYDPSWRITAHFTPAEPGRTIPYEHLRDAAGATRDLVVPGDITATIGDREYTLSAFDDDGTLLLVFGDPTNRSTDESERTYGTGRFLFVERPDGSSTGEESDVVLDFNQAFVPPCGFSDQYNCPLPPFQNRVHVPVHAGERYVAHRD